MSYTWVLLNPSARPMVLRNMPTMSPMFTPMSGTDKLIAFRGTEENVTINADGSASVDGVIVLTANQQHDQSPASFHKIRLHIAHDNIAYWFVTDDDTKFSWPNVVFCSGLGAIEEYVDQLERQLSPTEHP